MDVGAEDSYRVKGVGLRHLWFPMIMKRPAATVSPKVGAYIVVAISDQCFNLRSMSHIFNFKLCLVDEECVGQNAKKHCSARPSSPCTASINLAKEGCDVSVSGKVRTSSK